MGLTKWLGDNEDGFRGMRVWNSWAEEIHMVLVVKLAQLTIIYIYIATALASLTSRTTWNIPNHRDTVPYKSLTNPSPAAKALHQVTPLINVSSVMT